MKRGNYMRLGKVIIISALLGVSTPFLVKQTPVAQAAQETQNNTFTLEIASYAYRKDGKQVHLDELRDANGEKVALKQNGQVTLIPKGTVLKYYGKPVPLKTYIGTSSQTSNGDIKMYYSIGNGYYINAKNVGLPNGPANLTIDHNSYVYNYKGQRKKAKTIKKNTTLEVLGKFEEINSPKKFYSEYLSSSGIKFVSWQKRHRFWLKYKTIHGKQYYRIGKNRYIKANNVRYLDGKPIYVDEKETTVVLKSSQQIVNRNSNRESGRYYKKGKKLVVDKYISTFRGYPDDFWFKTGVGDSVFYHVKGTKDDWVWGRVSEVDVKRHIEPVNVFNQKNTTVQAKPGITKAAIYNSHGEQEYDDKFLKATNYNQAGYYPIIVKELKYIYVPSSKKVELFYRIKNNDYMQFFVNKERKGIGSDPRINDFYLKVEDFEYVAGPKLTPVNTPAEAEKDK